MGKTKFAIFILSIIVLTIVLPYSSEGVPLDYWNWRNPLPQGSYLTKVEYLNGIFVAVGENGAIVTSSDGVSWIARNSGTNEPLCDVAYGNGLFVAVGTGGIILTSPDAEVWTIRKPAQKGPPYTIHLLNVSYVNGVFAATGDGVVYTSHDGVDWILTTIEGYGYIGKVISGNGIYITVGRTQGTDHILVSSDGTSWAVAPMPDTFQRVYALSYVNGTFMIWGQAASVSLYWGETLYASFNGMEWTAQHAEAYGISKVVYGNGIFVAAESGSTYGPVKISWNGLWWLDMSESAQDVTYGNGMFAAVGRDGSIVTSTDGMNWTSHVTRQTTLNLLDVEFGNNAFVAVGTNQFWLTIEGNYIVTSREGVNWAVIPVMSNPLHRIAFLNGTFVALGMEGDLLTSLDGVQWGKPALGATGWLEEAAYGNGVFVVVGWGDTVLTSLDGITWIVRYSGLHVNFNGVIFAEGMFVATGHIPDSSAPPCWFGLCAPTSYGTILTSFDGINWTQRYLDTNYSSFSPVEYRNNEFVVVDWMDSTTLTSPDGINWTTHTNITPDYCVPWEDIGIREIHSFTYGNNTFLAVGASGMILQSNALGGACAATLSSDLTLHVPIINFNGTYLWCNAACEVSADGSFMCRITDYGEANPYAFSDCQPSKLSPDFALQVPSGIYNNISYRVEFEYVPTTDGQMWFKLSSCCPY